MPDNAYAISRTEGEFDTPEYAPSVSGYAVPGVDSDAPYNDEFGWAPSLRLSPEGIPDTHRLGTLPLYDYRPVDNRPATEWYGRLDAEEKKRESVTDQDADGWEETKEYPGYDRPSAGANRWARDPKENPPPEPRWTMKLGPRSYSFWRPFGTGLPKSGAKEFNGLHFSMADHRRDYEIYGMEPVRNRRNTYRIEPTPWDTNIVDIPAPDDTPEMRVVVSANVDYQSRSWRLM